jgi:hypothetical protein
MEVVNELEDGLEKVVLWPLKRFSEDYVQQTEFLKEA